MMEGPETMVDPDTEMRDVSTILGLDASRYGINYSASGSLTFF